MTITYRLPSMATENMSKYVQIDLQIECQRMRKKKVEAVPIVIEATGIVEKNIAIYLNKIPGPGSQDTATSTTSRDQQC